MYKITIFKHILETKTPYHVNVETIINRIKKGKNKDLIENIRKIEDKKERDKLKQRLPSICFSGIFERRAIDGIKEHSGLICIDFDHLENPVEFKERLKLDKYTFIAFLSPSGDGVKLIMKIPANISTHEDSAIAITQYFENEKLDEFKDISRVCYESYDPDIFVNINSELFNKMPVKQRDVTHVFYPKERITDYNEILTRIEKWLDKENEYYQDGNKHSFLVKLAAACLRFGIPHVFCSQMVAFKYSGKASFVKPKDIEKIISDVYRNYSSTACTAHFEQSGKPIYTRTKIEVKKEIFDITINSKDIIYLDNIKESMLDGFANGKARGNTTYYPGIDKHWTWRLREVNFLGGIGNMGKTTILMNLCLIKAIKEDWRFAFFSPEQDPPDDFYNELIHTYVGKSTEPYHSNQMTMDEYKDAMKFVKDHFFYIYPENESPTPDYINHCFEEVIKKHNVIGLITDPFNQLDNDWKRNGRDDLYISEFLSKEKRFVQKHNVIKFIVGHPKGNLTKTKGNYEMPTVYDYSGGAMWNNKTDNILAYHRPFAITEPENTMCVFGSQKIKKRKLTGIPGFVKMNFDIMTNRMVEENGYCPFGFTELKNENYDVNKFFEPDNELFIDCKPPF